MKRRTFSAEYKIKVVRDLLKYEKELNVIAREKSIAPNLLGNWKMVRYNTGRTVTNVCMDGNSLFNRWIF